MHLSLADTRCRALDRAKRAAVGTGARNLARADEHLRLDVLGHEIVGVVPDLQQEFSQAGEALVRLRFVMTERMLISARRTPVHSVEINRRAIESGKRFPSAVSLLDAVVDQFADAIGRMAERLGNELDGSRGRVDAGGAGRRAAPHRPRALAGGARAPAVGAIARHVPPHRAAHGGRPRAGGGRRSRALAQKLDAIDHEVASLHERARLLFDEVAVKMTEVTNRRLFALSVLTACLLPPTLVTGFFGMNTKDLPWQNTEGGTWFALAVALAAAAVELLGVAADAGVLTLYGAVAHPDARR